MKIEGDFRKKLKGFLLLKLRNFFIHTRPSLARAVFYRELSRPRYRPLLSVLVDSGGTECTTLQKLIVDSGGTECRLYES